MDTKTKKVEEIAKDVYRKLGSGFSEDVYDKSMQVGLRMAKIKYESQKVVELKYKDHCVGEGYPDIIAHLDGKKLVIELKAVGGELALPEEQQIKNYMKILKIKSGLLINFQQPGKKEGKTKLEVKEIYL
jgi:GxxExxY protein